MRNLTALALLLLAPSGLVAAPPAVGEASKALVVVVENQGGNQVGCSTGVAISPTYLLACQHGATSGTVAIEFPGEDRRTTADVVAADAHMDLALLRLASDRNRTWVRIAPGWAQAWPMPQVYGVTLDRIQAGHIVSTDSDWFYAGGIKTVPGNSGSGLFTADGELLGICKGVVLPGSPLAGKSIYARSTNVHSFLGRHWPEYGHAPTVPHPPRPAGTTDPDGKDVQASPVGCCWLLFLGGLILSVLFQRR